MELVVESHDYSHYDFIVGIRKEKMEEWHLHQGDIIHLRGREKKRKTICRVHADNSVPSGKIRMNRLVRNNLRVRIGDPVYVSLDTDVRVGDFVHVSPIDGPEISRLVQSFSGDIIETLLRFYFYSEDNPCRTIHEGNVFTVIAITGPIQFKVDRTIPTSYCIVTKATTVDCGVPIKRKKKEEIFNSVGYDDIGGCKKELLQIREMVELPLRYPQVFKSTAAKPPRPILLCGPHGAGKRSIARAVANETGAYFYSICDVYPLFFCEAIHQSQSMLRKAFEKVETKAPAIMFIEGLDCIAPKYCRPCKGRLLGSELLKLMNQLREEQDMIIIASTNDCDVDTIDPSIKYRFQQVDIGLPDAAGRLEILGICTRDMILAEDVDLEKVAARTQGYNPGQLAQLCVNAAFEEINHKLGHDYCEGDNVNGQVLNSLVITMKSFEKSIE